MSFRVLYHNKSVTNATVSFQQCVHVMSQQARAIARLHRMKKVAQRQ